MWQYQHYSARCSVHSKCWCLPPVTFIKPSLECIVFMSHSMTRFMFLWCLPGWRLKLMTQCDSTSSGRASTGGWQASQLGRWVGGVRRGRPGGSMRLAGGGGGAEGCGEPPATGGGRGQLQELGSRVGLDQWQISQNSPTRSISTALSRVSDRE